jgi:hemoglobin-like flavoprotein
MRLKESTDNILAITDSRLAGDFYHRLFARYPELQPLFADADWGRQRMALMMSLQIITYYHRVPNPTMRTYLIGLGAVHHKKGVQPEDYPKWKGVLLDVLKDHHGADWSRELEDDWTAALDEAIELMTTGSEAIHAVGEHTWVY